MYCPAADKCSWTCSWILETRSSCPALLYINYLIPVVGLSLVGLTLNGAPSLLSGKSVLSVFEFNSVILKSLFGDFDVLLLKADESFKLGLSVSESAVLVWQVVWEDGVVLGLFLLNLVELDLVGNEVLSELSDQFSNSLDGLEVNLWAWSDLSKGGDDGFQEGLFAWESIEFLVDGFESSLDLSEWGSELKVLNNLGSFVDGNEESIKFSVLSDIGGVLALSGGLFSGSSCFVVCDILGGLSDVDFSLLKSLSWVVSQLLVGSDLSSVIGDVVLKIDGNLNYFDDILLCHKQLGQFCWRCRGLFDRRWCRWQFGWEEEQLRLQGP